LNQIQLNSSVQLQTEDWSVTGYDKFIKWSSFSKKRPIDGENTVKKNMYLI
jgi:hypothetical protein